VSGGFSDLPVGTYEDALAMVGYTEELRLGEAPVSEATIKVYAALIEDANPSYWDTEWATRRWGSLVAPPGQLHTWTLPLTWRPQGADDRIALCARVPLPGSSLINTSTDVTFFRHVRVGDYVTLVETVTSISPPKTTRVGVGHFVVTTATYADQKGDRIAEYVNNLFRFEPHPEGAST
jgi:acyl dehydratase